MILHAQTILQKLVQDALGVGHGLAELLDARLVLGIGHTDDRADAVHVGEHAAEAVVVGDRAHQLGLTGVGHGGEVAAALLGHGDAGLVDAAHDGVEAHAAERHLGGGLGHVRRHAVGDAAVVLDVELDGLLDLVSLQPALLGRLLERPGIGLLLVDLTGGLVLLAVELAGPEDLGIHGRIGGSGVLEGRYGVRLQIEAHVGRGVLGRRLLEVGEQFLRLHGQLRVRVNQEGQVRPVLRELLVVELVLEDVAEPREQKLRVGAGTYGQPHVGLHGVGREVRVDDHGLHAGGAELRHAAAGLSGLGHGGLGAPDDHDLGLVVVHLEDLLDGVVGDGLVVAAVEELREGPTGQVALGAAGLEDGRATEGHGKRHGLHERVGAAAAHAGEERVVAVLVDSVLDMGGRLGDGLVPGDDLPLVLAALAGPAQGVQDAARAVHGVQLVEALDAQAAAGHRGLRIALEPHDHAVLQVGDGRAHLNAAMTARAHLRQALGTRDARLAGAGELLFRRSFLHAAGHGGAHRSGRARESGHFDEAATCQIRF